MEHGFAPFVCSLQVCTTWLCKLAVGFDEARRRERWWCMTSDPGWSELHKTRTPPTRAWALPQRWRAPMESTWPPRSLHSCCIHMLSHLTYLGRCHTPPRSSASCGSLAPRPLIFLVNAIVRDTLPRMGLLFAHKTQRTHPSCENRESRTALC